MSINNLNIIKSLLHFTSDDSYYFIQILQRKKEHAHLGRNSNVVKNYYIRSVEHLESKMDEIIKLCQFFEARAYIRLTPRSYKITALDNLRKVANCIADENYKAVGKTYLSSSGSTVEGKIARWIIDLDGELTEEYIDEVVTYINTQCRPLDNTHKIIALIPSKNGAHLITGRFDLMQFRSKYPTIEIHKDNPSNLFIP